MQKTIKIPKSAKDLRIRHFKAQQELGTIYDDELGLEALELSERVRIVALFIERSVNFVWSIDNDEFNKMWNHIINLFSTINVPNKPPKEIVVNGREWCLIDPNKCANAWHQDWNLFDIEKDAVKLACLFYHPKGHFYGEIDEHDNLIHPVSWKREQIEKEMELGIFISSARFFLLNYLNSTEQLIRVQIAKSKMENLIKKLPSFLLKKQSTQ